MIIDFKKCKIDINESWNNFFTNEIKEELSLIEIKIGNNFTPLPINIFRVMQRNIIDFKCCILGQDPYPQEGVATGRAFEVGTVNDWNDKRINTSLKNILKVINKNALNKKDIPAIEDVRNDILSGAFSILSPDKIFADWEKQGVLLLNTSLTCEKGSTEKSNSHKDYWVGFSKSLIQYIEKCNPEIIWLLWGKNAFNFTQGIVKNYFDCDHPRLNNKSNGSFFYENHFTKIKTINWTGTKIQNSH